MPTARPLTDGQRRVRVSALAADGYTVKEAAAELGCSRDEAWRAVPRGTFRGRRMHTALRAAVLDLLAAGLGVRAIGRHLGKPAGNLTRLLRRLERDGLAERHAPAGACGCPYRWRVTGKWS